MKTLLTTPESRALARICNEWYVSFGLMTVVVVASFWVSPLWMPLVELVLAIFLALFGTGGDASEKSAGRVCGRITLVGIYTLLITGLISFLITVAYHTEIVHLVFDISTLNHSIPYITALVIFPVCSVLSYTLTMKRVYAHHLHNCRLHNEYNPQQPLYGRIVHGVYRSLLKRLAAMTAIISVIDWGYYFICYRNISINKPDSFFFFVVPTAIYIWSIIYIRHSYRALGVANGKIIYASSNASSETSTVLTDSSVFRFLIVRDDRLLLDVNEASMNNCSVDTPIIEIKAHELKGSLESGRADIERITGLSEFKIKLLFTSEDVADNVTYYHFLVTLKPESESVNLQGHWLTLSAVNDLIKMGVVTSALANEIFRVYTMAMAWKTYDSKGYRRFPIRNYQPNFRLADLHDYDVDYNDKRWLRISTINQDAKWWFIRRFFL